MAVGTPNFGELLEERQVNVGDVTSEFDDGEDYFEEVSRQN